MKYWTLDLPYIPLAVPVKRTTGSDIIHLTDVIRFIEDQNNQAYEDDGTWDSVLTLEAGFIWEEELSRAFGCRMALRPDEIVCEGIYLSPDGIGTDTDILDPDSGEVLVHGTGQVTVEEYKFTWKSPVKKEGQLLVENPPTDNWRYMTQVKSYCHAVGTNIVIMRIFHVNGDYRTKRPIYRVCKIVFTDAEIQSNWEMIIKNAEKLRNKLAKKEETKC